VLAKIAVSLPGSLTEWQNGMAIAGFPQTPAEQAVGVTPTNYAYSPGWVRRYGAVGEGSTHNDGDALNTAGKIGIPVCLDKGNFYCEGPVTFTAVSSALARVSLSSPQN
jgi:hypothetical protein